MLPKENEFLRELARIANVGIRFKDERILPGTAWINEMPIDISIIDNYLILNSVGEFGGTASSYTKSKNKGKGHFQYLYPYIRDLIKSTGLEERIYLTPLSPVWNSRYVLCETNEPLKGNWYYLDTRN